MGSLVRLQILLKKEKRTPAGVAAVRAALEALGIPPTASGAASVSAAAEREVVARVFGHTAENAGLLGDTLPVPESLQEYVEHISIAPKHEYLDLPGGG